MQRNTGYFPTESLEPSGNRLFSRSALNEGDLFRGSLYMSTGMGAFGALQAHTVSDKICLENSKGYKWGTIVVGVVILVYFVYCTIVNWIRDGFSDFVIGYFFTAVCGVLLINEGRGKD